MEQRWLKAMSHLVQASKILDEIATDGSTLDRERAAEIYRMLHRSLYKVRVEVRKANGVETSELYGHLGHGTGD